MIMTNTEQNKTRWQNFENWFTDFQCQSMWKNIFKNAFNVRFINQHRNLNFCIRFVSNDHFSLLISISLNRSSSSNMNVVIFFMSWIIYFDFSLFFSQKSLMSKTWFRFWKKFSRFTSNQKTFIVIVNSISKILKSNIFFRNWAFQ